MKTREEKFFKGVQKFKIQKEEEAVPEGSSLFCLKADNPVRKCIHATAENFIF